MTEPTEKEFIQNFAKEWNETISKFLGKDEEGKKIYLGSLNLIYMLEEFLKAYRKREK